MLWCVCVGQRNIREAHLDDVIRPIVIGTGHVPNKSVVKKIKIWQLENIQILFRINAQQFFVIAQIFVV